MKQRPRGLESERRERPDDGNAFVPDTIGQMKPLPPEAESFAQEFIGAATAGEPVTQDAEDEVADDEEGGPFIVLDDDQKLPVEAAESSREREAHDEVQQEQMTRGANWAAKGV